MAARNFVATVNQIIALIPDPAPAEIADELTVLGAELRILKRAGGYTAPEAADDANLWQRLATTLYRYLPNPTGYQFAQDISNVVTGSNNA